MVCRYCGEIFENDTQYDHVICPNDDSMLLNCRNEQAAIATSENVKEWARSI
jgi:hypothetical protein